MFSAHFTRSQITDENERVEEKPIGDCILSTGGREARAAR